MFTFLDAEILPDHKLVAIANKDALDLGVLSSFVHAAWALTAGGHLGVGNDPVYSKSTCFETFPFPADDTGLTPALSERIRSLAEQLDALRKTQQAAHPTLTLTGMYNVLDKLRSGEPLSAKEKTVHEQGLVSVLRTLHDELDAAVLQAYGWADLGPLPHGNEAARTAWTDALLQRLVDLNTRRAAEEAQGTVRWLRPEFQNPSTTQLSATQVNVTQPSAVQTPMVLEEEHDEPASASSRGEDNVGKEGETGVGTAVALQAWPAALPEQIKAVAQVLAAAPAPLDMAAIAAHFKARGRWRERLPVILETLVALGRAQTLGEHHWQGMP